MYCTFAILKNRTTIISSAIYRQAIPHHDIDKGGGRNISLWSSESIINIMNENELEKELLRSDCKENKIEQIACDLAPSTSRTYIEGAVQEVKYVLDTLKVKEFEPMWKTFDDGEALVFIYPINLPYLDIIE
ncbi:hypothetical protein BJ944DRAFT_233595 [Cunninghamella echinulata]|nr:hypothetical protein BJ944DRAFT_233595 [Cunninghamella echinulata]